MGMQIEEHWVYCAECAGSGETASGGMCPVCGGQGEVLVEEVNDEQG